MNNKAFATSFTKLTALRFLNKEQLNLLEPICNELYFKKRKKFEILLRPEDKSMRKILNVIYRDFEAACNEEKYFSDYNSLQNIKKELESFLVD